MNCQYRIVNMFGDIVVISVWLICFGSILGILLEGPVCARPVGEQAKSIDAEVTATAVNERIIKQIELVNFLAENHGYKLAKCEPFKYIKDPQNEERSELRLLMMSSPGHGAFETAIGKPVPEQGEDSFEPFMLVLHMLPDGRVPFSTVSNGVITLGDVLDNVLQLKPYDLDCPPNLRLTYLPGDWVLLYEPDSDPVRSAGGAAALERILNKQCNLGVRVEWKMLKRPAITIRGKYAPKPAGGKLKDEREAALADGTFLIDARRALSYHPLVMSGDFEQFIESIGYLLMMPVVNEAETRPAKKIITWNEAGKSVEGNDRLRPEHEQRLLQSLSEQTGYEFRVEPREVKLLFIQPAE